MQDIAKAAHAAKIINIIVCRIAIDEALGMFGHDLCRFRFSKTESGLAQ